MDIRTLLVTRAKAELADGRGLVLAAATGAGLVVLGGDLVTAAVGSALVEAAKLGAGLAAAMFAGRRRRVTDAEAVEWLERAELALGTLRRLAGGAQRGPLATRFQETAARAAATVWVMRRLAEQGSAVGQLLGHIAARDISAETALLERELAATADARIRGELTTSLGSLRTQADARSQLAASRQALIARMRTVALGMEGLVARVAELLAISASGMASPDDRLDELDTQLEALRESLLETERIGRERIARLATTSLLEVRE
ncbi:MAG TPA: hypothetical protein VFM93_12415 [Candidatus Limnocylindria bacterium]|nr:hypothetical protein [Candidatus Limnocylindria bacterium]